MHTEKWPEKIEEEIEEELDQSQKLALQIGKSALSHRRFSRILRILGPGVVTGAADDDPSGIATYSQAGAQAGFGLLWAFPIMLPLLIAIQETCARIGAVTGRGLAAVIKDHYSRKVLYFAVALVVVANTINIGADLGAMAATSQLFINWPYALWATIYAALILLLVLTVSYKNYAKILKWLTLTLLAYPATVLLIGIPWREAIAATFTPHLSLNYDAMFILVAMFGTTISPYLFFWDTSEVVEDEITSHRLKDTSTATPAITRRFMKSIRLDNIIGMVIAVAAAWFIVVLCGTVLHGNGIREINSASDAAKALEPLVKGFPNAGLVARIIFSTGIIGLGLLAIPVLSGSSSYAISEVIGWKEGLHRRFKRAVGFYTVIIGATLIGLAINFAGINPIRALIFTAVFNGIASIPLLLMITRISNNARIMGNYKNSRLSNIFLRAAFLIMLGCGIFLFLSIFMH